LVDLGKELGADDLTLIPNAIAHNVYRLINPVTARSQQVAMLYSKAAVKGSEYGIAALNIVKRRFPELKAVLFGTCPRQPSIPDWIEYHYNPKQRVIIEHIYNTSAIFLSSSLSEGFPLPPAEAAACGCALVATDIGGFREYISHGKTGLLSAPTDVDGLVRNMSLLLGDSRRRVALATAAGIHVRTFTWPRSTDLLEDFIKGCCNARNAQSVLC
jgi:glycosyltransferase involved in cell wall biosynthesis